MEDAVLRRQIDADILRAYGNLDAPDYRWLKNAAASTPYAALVDRLRSLGVHVADKSDSNEDVCLWLELRDTENSWLLLLSYVGKYALLSHENGGQFSLPVTHADRNSLAAASYLLHLLHESDIALLDNEMASTPCRIALFITPMHDATFYQALFTDEVPYFRQHQAS